MDLWPFCGDSKTAGWSTATSVVSYMAENCLTLNPEKTQVLWINSGKFSPCIKIGSSLVTLVNSVGVLGMKFDRSLKSDPHIRELTSVVASLTGVARYLRVHLPPDLLAVIMKALLVGKINYGAAAMLLPCLDQDAPCSALSTALQVRVNNVARVVCSLSRLDHHSTAYLLERSGLPSVNHLAIRSVAVEAWKSLGPWANVNDNLLASIFGPPLASCTRAGEQGIRKLATRFPTQTFINSATTIWSSCAQLRSAPSIEAAKWVATTLAMAYPL